MVKLNNIVVENLFKKYNVPTDNLDYRALWDSSLSLAENKTILIGHLKNLSRKNDEIIAEQSIEQFRIIEEEVRKKEVEILNKEFDEVCEEIKRNKSVELDEKFKLPKELIKIAVNQKQSLILVGESGLGKTYLTLKTLKEMNLKNEDDFIFINSYLTPLALYKKLYEFRNKTIVLDDCENILTDNTSISILKSATFNSVGKKLVSYFSTTEKLEDTPTTFEFSGTLIILLNRIPRKCNYEVKSLIARCLNYDLKFNWQEKIVILYMMAKNLNIPSKIVDFIKANSSEAMELNFRTLIQSNLIFEYYKTHPSENNGRSWEIVVKELLFRSENSYLKMLIDLENSGKPVEEQVKLWNEKTGLGRRSFFLYKKKVQKCN